MSEHDEQAALFDWAARNEGNYPELEMLYAVPNAGKRPGRTGARMVAEGLKKGVWDVTLDVAMRDFIGLKIEMKFGRNGLTPDQKLWSDKYLRYGHKTTVCWDWADAARQILIYLGYDIPEDLR